MFHLKIYRWNNTNKLLKKGWMGIKTGITDAAGPCLAAYIPILNCNMIAIVLNCSSLDLRFIFIHKKMERMLIVNEMGL